MAQSGKGQMDFVRREGNGRRGRGFPSRRLSSLVVLALVVVLMAGMVQHTLNFVHGLHSMGRTTVVVRCWLGGWIPSALIFMSGVQFDQ